MADVAVVVGVVLTRSFDVDRTSIFVINLDWRQAQIVTNRNGSAPEVKDETADAEAEARLTEAEAEAEARVTEAEAEVMEEHDEEGGGAAG